MDSWKSTETLEQAAARELQEETGLTLARLKQISAFSTVDRDPRGRVISVAFLGELTDDQQAVAADDAKSLAWFAINSLPPLAFDHEAIIQVAMQSIG